MPVEIQDAGASLKIITNGVPRYVLKNHISEVVLIAGNVIKLEKSENALRNIYITFADVDAPVTANAGALRDAISVMLNDNSGIAANISDILVGVNTLNAKLFYAPLLVDETKPNFVYNGYAALGSQPSDPVWAIQRVSNNAGMFTYEWANGTQDFNNIWDNRDTLIYS